MKTRSDKPLSELSILDISTGIAGPFCSKLLGDLGANVVKVESPAFLASSALLIMRPSLKV